MTINIAARPQLAQPALIPGLEAYDWGIFREVLGAPCQGCGHKHRGLFLHDGGGRCEVCGHAYAMAKPEPKALKRRPPIPRAAVINRCPTSTPRPRAARARVVAASGRDGDGKRDDGGGSSDPDGGGGDSPPSRLITVPRCDRDREPFAGRRS